MKGKVYLVGAGPGDDSLITLKGLKCIKKADVIIYDRLINNNLLKESKKNCKFIYVGKKSKKHIKTQDEINEIIYREALEGKIVVRLKGGDPYVFGRGGEEGEYLAKRNIPFEIVPGVTSAIGGLAYAGIPITHRNYASSFHVITGHLKDENDKLNWEVLASLDGTIVFLMGISNLENISKNLIENGKDKNTPVAIVSWATMPYQKVVEGNLSNIYEKAMKYNIVPPSIIVIGNVVKLRKNLNFFERKILFGETIIVTRAREQKKEFVDKLREFGATTYEFPTIKIDEITPNIELENAIENIEQYTYLLLTSVNGVNIFFKKLFSLGYDSRKLGGLKIGVIGSKTAKAMERYGIKPDFIPKEYVSEFLTKYLKNVLTTKDKVLLPRAKNSRSYLVEELSKICDVDEIKIYNTVKGTDKAEELVDFLKDKKEFYLTFTSPSTFNNFVEILGDNSQNILKRGKILSIGPVTSKVIREGGHEVYGEARKHTIEGIIDLLIKERR
ncbi:uroporphyrinogen III methyltransferase/synthase [Keratinibaculum paraultunense]|uniref:uroporphyrinogen-III C-methyltransferase n=1 Tax=Keratinibaculum paraultunense TaxID=1278232 RepID=A0A4R3KRF6_9FIRM|nr:uroporphyrinogen-III C-methyltransferase [Keratinibaculum paraultunense]QQY79549.1 uroporphyrinogen-III C-methyltransferase [Keratinibaculum paraultunense]TCS87574.1 uroporphyrinogen III methyltransferase/synthase [Keratinibaculum paraultunense]